MGTVPVEVRDPLGRHRREQGAEQVTGPAEAEPRVRVHEDIHARVRGRIEALGMIGSTEQVQGPGHGPVTTVAPVLDDDRVVSACAAQGRGPLRCHRAAREASACELERRVVQAESDRPERLDQVERRRQGQDRVHTSPSAVA